MKVKPFHNFVIDGYGCDQPETTYIISYSELFTNIVDATKRKIILEDALKIRDEMIDIFKGMQSSEYAMSGEYAKHLSDRLMKLKTEVLADSTPRREARV